MKSQTKKNIFSGFLILILAGILYYIIRSTGLVNFTDINSIMTNIQSYGIISPIIYIIIMAVAIVISPIPSLPLAAASGLVWGPFLGTLYSIIGAEIGAIASFFIARKIGREFVRKLIRKDIKFSDKFENKYGPIIVFVARLFPVFQFDIISYGAGLTSMDWKKFAIATFFGMIPATFAFTYFGNAVFSNNNGLTAIIFSIVLIILMFLVPLGMKRYNIFGFEEL